MLCDKNVDLSLHHVPQKEAPVPQKKAPVPQKEAPVPQKEAPVPQKEALCLRRRPCAWEIGFCVSERGISASARGTFVSKKAFRIWSTKFVPRILDDLLHWFNRGYRSILSWVQGFRAFVKSRVLHLHRGERTGERKWRIVSMEEALWHKLKCIHNRYRNEVIKWLLSNNCMQDITIVDLVALQE